MSVALCWIRRDLRLKDNDALHAALNHADQVIPVYVLDPVLLERYAGTKRVAFLFGAIRQLDADLRTRGSRLVVRRGGIREALGGLVQETVRLMPTVLRGRARPTNLSASATQGHTPCDDLVLA